jgi:GTPase SAR1 family protein
MSDDLFTAAGIVTEDVVTGSDDSTIYVEQAEYLPPESFQAYTINHPKETEIVRKLIAGGAKLLVGPRGCGKTTLMLRAFYQMLHDTQAKTLPVYVNFKLSLKLEPLYQSTPNATFWFRTWLILKIYEGLHRTLEELEVNAEQSTLPSFDEVTNAIMTIESGDPSAFDHTMEYQADELLEIIEDLLDICDLNRCILLLDDAAHAFSPKQQEDFFDFFRRIKGQRVAPKAAIYPGITNLSPSFHLGHDAEQIDVWVRPDSDEYVEFMRSIAAKRLGGVVPTALAVDSDVIPFLAYCAFGIPRSFLNMIRFLESDINNSNVAVDRRKVLDAAKQSRQDAHGVFDSLIYKLPVYRNFILKGDEIYTKLISNLKIFNKVKLGDLYI